MSKNWVWVRVSSLVCSFHVEQSYSCLVSGELSSSWWIRNHLNRRRRRTLRNPVSSWASWVSLVFRWGWEAYGSPQHSSQVIGQLLKSRFHHLPSLAGSMENATLSCCWSLQECRIACKISKSSYRNRDECLNAWWKQNSWKLGKGNEILCLEPATSDSRV